MAIQDYTKLNLVETAAPKLGPTPLMQALDMWIANRKEKRDRAMEERKMGLEERRVKATEESTRAQIDEAKQRTEERKTERADKDKLKAAAKELQARMKSDTVLPTLKSPRDQYARQVQIIEEVAADMGTPDLVEPAMKHLESKRAGKQAFNNKMRMVPDGNGGIDIEVTDAEGQMEIIPYRRGRPQVITTQEGAITTVIPSDSGGMPMGGGSPALSGMPQSVRDVQPQGPLAPDGFASPALGGGSAGLPPGAYTIMGQPRREPRGGGGATQDDKMTTLATNMAYKDLQKAQDALDALPFKYDQRKKQINAMYPKPQTPKVLTTSAVKEYNDAKVKYETERSRAMADLEQEKIRTERSLIARRDQAAQALKLAGTGNGAAAFDALSTRSPALAPAPDMGMGLGLDQESAFDNTTNPAVNPATPRVAPGAVGSAVNPVQMGPEAQNTMNAPWLPAWLTGARNEDAAREILMRNQYRPAALSPGLVP